MMTPARLRSHGWRQIRSEAQANQLLRRELKRYRGTRQRHPDWPLSYEALLTIRKGAWYKLLKFPAWLGIVIWNGPVAADIDTAR